ncbi:3-methyl-2-oxobutanoate hydroxymethyltransferase [Leptospira perolatii]|uniref:3-methyl-2-oxobutanoate hydroxymethyltransferase n=1 Tax=Leptospira perolatii TaxID=2023191 RepID=A0A2M9ZID2_9LEPT|nr:3-methyl-2-oxobutanoate hydroxymethyltransferase [Leptospira perolatii]PJZ68105.1 3-methyl-2-oxobutanoate hydroxymethyltransferase [Leptospira perolatii]PJZ71724.1 3-methyl-2-oxobutanoate hydroxymethyltransferase [Leptospira perolatii]
MRDVHKVFPRGNKPLPRKISVLTCYDFTFAKLLEEAEVDSILVGDSLGMVVQGQRSTLPVTLDEMIYHAKAARRGAPKTFIVTDLPFLSYQVSLEDAIQNAGRVMKETDCDAVKIEGGSDEILELVRKLERIGVPVMGHIGLTPQSINVFGGHKVQGKADQESAKLLREAKDLSNAGAFSVVLELVPAHLANEITSSIHVPTIGIGAGPGTDGQVLVLYDLLGLNKDFHPKFLKTFLDGHGAVLGAIQKYKGEVESGTYPGPENSY